MLVKDLTCCLLEVGGKDIRHTTQLSLNESHGNLNEKDFIEGEIEDF